MKKKMVFTKTINEKEYKFTFSNPNYTQCTVLFLHNGKEKRLLLQSDKYGDWKIEDTRLPDDIAFLQVDFHEALEEFIESQPI